ncbi:MAG TPA: MOSC domain-containing protein [Pyrinomonadaceae bacterium]|jgi:MOSC domain-containing protein YiiM
MSEDNEVKRESSEEMSGSNEEISESRGAMSSGKSVSETSKVMSESSKALRQSSEALSEGRDVMSEGYIFQLNCSAGGVPKRATTEALLTKRGLVGDRQAKPFIHGGPKRALCLYAFELIEQLQLEGHPVFPGSVGENVTVAGVDWAALEPGSRLALGPEVTIEISSYTSPCRTIAASFTGGEFARISQQQHPGWSRLYARVLQTGLLKAGQPVRII